MYASASGGSIQSASARNWLTYFQQQFDAQRGKYLLQSMVWYFGWPLVLFIIWAPGFLLSIPAVRDCDDNVVKPIAPGRVEVKNVLVQAAIFLVILIFLYYIGARMGIDFPFQFTTLTDKLPASAALPLY